jgi:bifunctional non-homologous end joining protein LigD
MGADRDRLHDVPRSH